VAVNLVDFPVGLQGRDKLAWRQEAVSRVNPMRQGLTFSQLHVLDVNQGLVVDLEPVVAVGLVDLAQNMDPDFIRLGQLVIIVADRGIFQLD
jgi:hypothetical protein